MNIKTISWAVAVFLVLRVYLGAQDIATTGRGPWRTSTYDPTPGETTPEDKAWEFLWTNNPNNSGSESLWREMAAKFGGAETAEFRIWREKQLREFRDIGRRRWKEFPGDPRRFEWLLSTVWCRPSYWVDMRKHMDSVESGDWHKVPVDKDACRLWKWDYLTLRSEFLASADTTELDRRELLAYEMYTRVWDARDAWSRRETIDLWELASDIVFRFATNIRDEPTKIERGCITAFLPMLETGSARNSFIEALSLTKNSYLYKLVSGIQAVEELRTAGFNLRLPILDDKGVFDIASLRGKIVFVDIWNNHCGSCISAMPKIERLKKKYAALGFEVVGIWLESPSRSLAEGMGLEDSNYYSSTNQRRRAIGILSEQGATWVNIIAPDREFCEKYGITGVPVTWLLDRKGRLIAADLPYERLEVELQRALEPEAD